MVKSLPKGVPDGAGIASRRVAAAESVELLPQLAAGQAVTAVSEHVHKGCLKDCLMNQMFQSSVWQQRMCELLLAVGKL
jgi:hypothetical protein